ncbi:MAG: hypothetical protein AB7V44_28305 [Pseudonocardia sp.]
MTEHNGNGVRSAVVVPAQPDNRDDRNDRNDRERYRPKPDRDRVYAEIERGLGSMVSEAAFQAGQFVALSNFDTTADPTVRHGHLVDAAECFELALAYLGQLKQLLSHQIRVTDDGADPAQRF